MQKYLLLILILICHNLCWAETDNSSDDSSRMSTELLTTAEADFNRWFNQLNEHLLDANDNYQKVMGLTAIINGTISENNQGIDATDTNKLLSNLSLLMNKIIQQDDLSDSTMELLVSWCFKPQIKSFCDLNSLLDKQLKQSPNNLNVYLVPLNIALEQQDQPLVNQIIALMALAKNSYHSHFISPEFNHIIDQYIAQNPIPETYVAAFKDDKALLSGLPHKLHDQIDSLIAAYFPTAIKMSYVYLNTTPEFKPLYEVCQSTKDLLPQCLQITQTLINHSNTLIARGIGYATLMAMHESRGKTELLNKVAEKHESFKAKIQCLSKTTQSVNFIENLLDPAFQKINLQAIDELELKQQLADYIYAKYKDKYADMKDPEGC